MTFKKTFTILLFALALLAGAPGVSPAKAEPTSTPTNSDWRDRLAVHTEGIMGAVRQTQEGMWDRSNMQITSRHLAGVAAAELRVNKDPVKAWEALKIVFDHQNVDTGSPHYGVYTTKIWESCYYGLECLQLTVPPYTKTIAGSFAGFEQTVTVGDGPHVLEWQQKRTFLYSNPGYHLQQILVDGAVVWEEQANTGDQNWLPKSVDLTGALAGKTQATITMRLYERRAVGQLPVKISFGDFSLSGTSLDADLDNDPWAFVTSGEGVSAGVTAPATGDINQNSFTSILLAGILNSEDLDLLTPEQQSLLKERARIGSWLTDGEPHAQLGYTNARLIRDIHMILIGQAVGDQGLYDLGLAHFRGWLAYTKEWGIREYNSPVYYGVDLDALMIGHSYIDDDAVRSEFAWALDLFWWDMAANYFPGREVLSGSHSRDYDFLRGTGPSAYFLSIEGWMEMPLLAGYTTFNVTKIQSFWGENIYHPSEDQAALAFMPFKEVEAKTDPDRNLDRYNYVADNWAMGSTSTSFTNVIPGGGGPTPYDKPIAIDLAGDRTTGHISIVPSWNTDPYGITYPGSAPLHAPLWPTTAQRKGALLTQLDLNPSGQRVPKYTTSVLIPSDADLVTLDGQTVDTTVAGRTEGALDSTLLVKVDDACAVIRLLGAVGIEGQTPTVSLVAEEDGLKWRMARLEILQFQSETPVRLTTTSAPVGFYLQAATCTSDASAQALAQAVADASVAETMEGDVRVVSLTAIDGTELEIGTDTVLRDPAFRLVNGVQMLAPSILNVNGVDVLEAGSKFRGRSTGNEGSGNNNGRAPWDVGSGDNNGRGIGNEGPGSNSGR